MAVDPTLGPVVRPARLGDAPGILAAARELTPYDDDDLARAAFRSLLAHPDHAVRVAVVDGRLVGWVHVCRTLRLPAGAFAELAGLVVVDGWRRRGLGRQLVEAAADWARDQGLAALRVRTNVARAHSLGFYRGLGFTCHKQQHVLVRREVI